MVEFVPRAQTKKRRGEFCCSPVGVGHSGNAKITGWSVGTATMPPGDFAVVAKFPGGVGSPRPTSHCIKCARAAGTPNLLFLIYYFLFVNLQFANLQTFSPLNIVSPAALLHNTQKTFTLWRKNSAKTLDKHPLYRV